MAPLLWAAIGFRCVKEKPGKPSDWCTWCETAAPAPAPRAGITTGEAAGIGVATGVAVAGAGTLAGVL